MMEPALRAKNPTELIIPLIAPIGVSREEAIFAITDELGTFGYEVKIIRVSRTIQSILPFGQDPANELDRIRKLISRGNYLRKHGQPDLLAQLAAKNIQEDRPLDFNPAEGGRFAYIIDSIKNPNELSTLRRIYPGGVYSFALYLDKRERVKHLQDRAEMSPEEAADLVQQDSSDGNRGHGQDTRKSFQLADFFIDAKRPESLRHSVARMVRLLFGDPSIAPTFAEYAMYCAYANSFRSLDLSRQVGAVIAQGDEIVAMGANEVPRFGGGQYWPVQSEWGGPLGETPNGRDYERGFDSNQREREKIMVEVEHIGADRDKLKSTRIGDLTEFGRIVHAEMEALLSCSRRGQSTKGGALYTTTFPCHNCAKHIVGAGLERVIYIEPYPKSLALELHADSVSEDEEMKGRRTLFYPFIGVGPRQFVNLFSMHLGQGTELCRKLETGERVVLGDRQKALPRVAMIPYSYLDLEKEAANHAGRSLEKLPPFQEEA